MEAVINEDGAIGDITIMVPAGAGFDENAIDAVSKWKYTPTLVDGKPARVVTTITVNFAFSQ